EDEAGVSARVRGAGGAGGAGRAGGQDVMNAEERLIHSRVSRREFMGATAAATLSALVGREPRLVRAEAAPGKATADAVIVLWMAGGMAQTETFDPKRYTPFEP